MLGLGVDCVRFVDREDTVKPDCVGCWVCVVGGVLADIESAFLFTDFFCGFAVIDFDGRGLVRGMMVMVVV